MKTQHTPTPWKAIIPEMLPPYITGADGIPLADAVRYGQKRETHVANAVHIVKCVNMHDELVRALENIVSIEPGWEQYDDLLKRAKGEL